MSNSATSAAKRRRAGPLLSSPLFLPPQSFQTNNPVAENNLNMQPEKSMNVQSFNSEPQPTDSKFMTIQQVINLITMRLITVENFMNESGDKAKSTTPVSIEAANIDYDKVAEICRSIMNEHVAEFDHRYAILAEEISNLKNIVLNLQNYTMEVNKTLMDERLQQKHTVKQENTETAVKEEKEEDCVPHIEFQFDAEQESEEAASEDPFSLRIVSKKNNKESEEELTF
jgi:hypothetical protein